MPSQLKTKLRFGFLAVSQRNGLGCCGGLLVVNSGGRPVEFHCTAPVIANRAQEILYGATLEEYLLNDRISKSLLDKSDSSLDIVVIDNRMLRSTANFVDHAFVEIVRDSKSESFDRQITIAAQVVNVIKGNLEEVESVMNRFVDTLPLSEPFDRIYNAINEAHSEAA